MDRNEIGNAATLREALQMFVDSVEWLCAGDESGRIRRQFAVLLSDARAALSAPPRNCDVFPTWEKAAEAWGKSPEWSECPDAGWAWLFDPAKKEGGK